MKSLLINKTKRIAERSDTNCDTHTHTHTHRQSTLDKYMIKFSFKDQQAANRYGLRHYTSNPYDSQCLRHFCKDHFDELLMKFVCVGLSLPGRADRTRATDDAHRSSTKHQGVFYTLINIQRLAWEKAELSKVMIKCFQALLCCLSPNNTYNTNMNE